MNLRDVPTPALLVDIDILDSNLHRMAAHVANCGKKLRPHAKAHKCINIAKRQIQAGAAGICVATVSEAALFIRAGIPGVLLTSPVADVRKCARVAELAKIAPDTAAVVDNTTQVRWYSEAAKSAGVKLNLLVDLDLGDHRTGILPGEPALVLAREILADEHLAFSGLQAYSVRASHMLAAEGRSEYAGEAFELARETQELLTSQGIPVPSVTGGSTGSYLADSELPYVTELQAGSYALMDGAYAKIGGIDFGHALTVLATVVSANYPDRVTVDAGFKAFATDRPFGPDVAGNGKARYAWAGDEFGYVFHQEGPRPGLGDRVRFIPPHCDPTVNLYQQIFVCRGENVEEIWPVMDRKTDAIN